MSDYADFGMDYDFLDPTNTDNVSLEELDQADEFSRTLDMSFLDFLASSKPTATSMVKMEEELKKPEMPLPSGSGNSRFATATEDQMKQYDEARQSKSTKSNTKWAINIFQGIVFQNKKREKKRRKLLSASMVLYKHLGIIQPNKHLSFSSIIKTYTLLP